MTIINYFFEIAVPQILEYFKENKEEIPNHLVLVSKNADNLLNNLMESYKKSDEKLSKKNKEINQLEWVKLMNNYKNMAEEVILKELIYTENV